MSSTTVAAVTANRAPTPSALAATPAPSSRKQTAVTSLTRPGWG